MYDNSTSRTEEKDNIMKCIMDSIEVHSQSYIECEQKSKELLEDTFRNISLEFMTTIRRIFFIDKIKMTEINELLTKLASLKNIIFLTNEKNMNHWKSNSFIDHCLYKKSSNIENLLYKYYFRLKRLIKDIIY